MYVRKKKIKGRTYYYIVKSVREGKKIKQVYMEYLGDTLPDKKELKEIIKTLS